ncbi:hypothetical protein [Anaerofustis stercorihominis]|uniref:hypothetical protein n=1 Tax=Anaerofustis stercorihominis TaxID=214853 RepID=UPI002671BDEA|nr:hypothetical protein [Anaerofustis stercorihominis]
MELKDLTKERFCQFIEITSQSPFGCMNAFKLKENSPCKVEYPDCITCLLFTYKKLHGSKAMDELLDYMISKENTNAPRQME